MGPVDESTARHRPADVHALLDHVLQPLGVGRTEVTPIQLMIGPHEAGPFEGRLYYDVDHDEVDSLYVQSVEMWTVLEPYLNEEGGAELTWTLPDREDALVGTIAFNGDSGWSNREPFAFAGQGTQVLYLAAPPDRVRSITRGCRQRWTQAQIARRAALLAADARGWDPAAVTVAILLVGAGATTAGSSAAYVPWGERRSLFTSSPVTASRRCRWSANDRCHGRASI